MNIKDFLIDNYIWIIVVILLLIITVIGFLADKSKNKKEKASKNENVNNQAMLAPNMNAQPINYQNQQPMNYQPNNNMNMQQPIQNQGMPVNFNGPINTTVTPLNQNVTVPTEQPAPAPLTETTVPNVVTNMAPNFGQATPNNMQPMNNSQPIDVTNTMNNVNPEPIYQPLSEQKPVISPKEIQPMNQINPQNMEPTIPTPLEASNIPIQPTNPKTIINQGMSAQPMTQSMINEPINPAPQPNFQNMAPNFQNNNMAGTTNPMNYSAPTLSPVPEPIPNAMPSNTIPNPVTPPQPVNPQPINFVYGPQQPNNNNQMM